MGDKVLTDGDKARVEKRLEAISKENQRFERIVVSRDEALTMFQENKFKVRTAASRSTVLVPKFTRSPIFAFSTEVNEHVLSLIKVAVK